MKPSTHCGLFLIPILLLAIGCSNLEKPSASIQGMSLGTVDANGFTMNFDVDLNNPNSVELPIANGDYKLALAGVEVLNGKATPSGSIPANGSKRVTLPVTVPFENLLSARDALVKTGGDFNYALDAGLSFNTGVPLVGEMRVPMSYSGKLPLKQIVSDPKLLLKSPAARKVAEQILGSLF